MSGINRGPGKKMIGERKRDRSDWGEEAGQERKRDRGEEAGQVRYC